MMMKITSRNLVAAFLPVALFLSLLTLATEAFQASHGWTLTRPNQSRVSPNRKAASERRAVSTGEEYTDLMSKLEATSNSVGKAVVETVTKSIETPPPAAIPRVLDIPSLPSLADIEVKDAPLPSISSLTELVPSSISVPDSVAGISVPDSVAGISVPDNVAGISIPDSVTGIVNGDVPLMTAGLALAAIITAAVVSLGRSGPDKSTASTTTASKPNASQSSSTMEVDISIPYDAAARLAYDEAGQPGDYDTFKKQYEEKAVADVKGKQKAKTTA